MIVIDKDRMSKALNAKRVALPQGLSRREIHEFIMTRAKEIKTMNDISIPSDRLENYHIYSKGSSSNDEPTNKVLCLNFLIQGDLDCQVIFFRERPNNVDEFKECLGREIGEYQLSLIDDYRMRTFFFGVFGYQIEQKRFGDVIYDKYTDFDGRVTHQFTTNQSVFGFVG